MRLSEPEERLTLLRAVGSEHDSVGIEPLPHRNRGTSKRVDLCHPSVEDQAALVQLEEVYFPEHQRLRRLTAGRWKPPARCDRMNSPARQLLPKCRVFGTGSDGEPPVEQRCPTSRWISRLVLGGSSGPMLCNFWRAFGGISELCMEPGPAMHSAASGACRSRWRVAMCLLTVPGLQKMRIDVEDELILVMVVLAALPVQTDVWDCRFKRTIFVKYIKKDL
eukprot:symbB.v1.2.021966.t1/scaffold1899.1/size238565/2